jgi:hypothetical protein
MGLGYVLLRGKLKSPLMRWIAFIVTIYAQIATVPTPEDTYNVSLTLCLGHPLVTARIRPWRLTSGERSMRTDEQGWQVKRIRGNNKTRRYASPSGQVLTTHFVILDTP